jgi:hypothetical protein
MELIWGLIEGGRDAALLFRADLVYNCGMSDCEDGFQALLERIRRKEHPEFGSLSWNGQSRQITETVIFETNGVPEPDEVIRDRALRYLEGLTPKEQAVAEVNVIFKGKTPVRAIMRAQTAELSPERLKELRQQAGLDSQ